MPLKSLIDDDYVNTGRQTSFDVIKAFAIVYMIIIHVYEEMTVAFSSEPTVLGQIIEFFGGPLAAPVFLIAMGLGIVYSKHRTPLQLFKRGLKIMAYGYLLNIARAAISYYIAGKIGGFFDLETFLYFIFQVDILPFCGVAFMFIALLKKINVPAFLMPMVGVIMQFIGSFINYESTTVFGKYVLILLCKSSYLSYFPLLNWFVYPALGILTGRYLKQITSLDRWHAIFNRTAILFVIGIIGGSLYYGINPLQYFTVQDDVYYSQNFFSTLFCLNIVIIVECQLYFLFKKWNNEKFNKLIYFMSDNLNTIYIIQWMIIGNCLVLFFETGLIEAFEIWMSIPIGLVIVVVSTYLAKYARKYIKA